MQNSKYDIELNFELIERNVVHGLWRFLDKGKLAIARQPIAEWFDGDYHDTSSSLDVVLVVLVSA